MVRCSQEERLPSSSSNFHLASCPFPYHLLASHGQITSSSVLLPSVSATKLFLLVRSPSVPTRLFSSLSKRPLASFLYHISQASIFFSNSPVFVLVLQPYSIIRLIIG